MRSLVILLFSGFLNFVGIALVYPLFAYLLFDPSQPFLPETAGEGVRGFWLGILIALQPAFQFLSNPFYGIFSDRWGRKTLFLWSLILAIAGYVTAIIGVFQGSLALLALYRILVGLASGNTSILSAMITDLSAPEEKSRNFGLLNMAFGIGFTIGPFLGGALVDHLERPFECALFLVTLNVFLVYFFLPETHKGGQKSAITLPSFKRVLRFGELRILFLTLLLFAFGWTFYIEFLPLVLDKRFAFAPQDVGLYYGLCGLAYALFAGYFIRPIIKRIEPIRLLFTALLLTGLSIFLYLIPFDSRFLWIHGPILQLFLAIVFPLTATLISNRVAPEVQGEVMGFYQATISLAFALCPLMMGGLVGLAPTVVIIGGGGIMVVAALIFALFEWIPRRLPEV